MRGVGGPLLTIGDLLSDLAVDGGDESLAGVGDAPVPSSPLSAQSAGEADPADLSRLFEVLGVPLLLFQIWFAPIDSPMYAARYVCCFWKCDYLNLEPVRGFVSQFGNSSS